MTNLSDINTPIAVRIEKAKALAKDKSPKAIDLLLTGIDTKDEKLRAAVLASLKTLKGDTVLVQRAQDTKRSVDDRVKALGGLRMLKPEQGVAVAALLDDKEEAVREAAAFALCVFGTAAAEAKLVTAMKSEQSSKVRYFVAVALGELKTPAAKTAITNALKTEQDFVVKDALSQAQRKQERP